MSNITKLLADLGAIRQKKSEVREVLKGFDEAENELKSQVEATLKDIGLKSAKTEDGKYSAAIATRKNLTVTDQEAFLDYIKREKLGLNQYIRVDQVKAKPLLSAALEKTGELLPGAKLEETEYLVFKEAKSE